MPTNPTTPNSNAAVGRLALGVESPRGAEASHGVVALPFACFEAEASGFGTAEPNGVPGVTYPCMGCSACFEVE